MVTPVSCLSALQSLSSFFGGRCLPMGKLVGEMQGARKKHNLRRAFSTGYGNKHRPQSYPSNHPRAKLQRARLLSVKLLAFLALAYCQISHPNSADYAMDIWRLSRVYGEITQIDSNPGLIRQLFYCQVYILEYAYFIFTSLFSTIEKLYLF